MKLKSLMAAACAALALGGFAAANNYYVDANNGNDLWDGSTPEIPSAEVQAAGGTIPGPKKTLEKVMTDCNPVSGDTVHAAAGVYQEGSMDKWCRVNVRFLKADKPDRQTLLDRYAKVILKGFVYACGGGAALDGRSSSCYSTNTLKGLDNAGITVSPDSYFPMLEVLRLVGGDEILSPAITESEGE